jgi:hypothetical protein
VKEKKYSLLKTWLGGEAGPMAKYVGVTIHYDSKRMTYSEELNCTAGGNLSSERRRYHSSAAAEEAV